MYFYRLREIPLKLEKITITQYVDHTKGLYGIQNYLFDEAEMFDNFEDALEECKKCNDD